MGFLSASVRKDLARWLRDPMAFVLWLGIPFLIGGLMTLMTSGGGSPTGTLLIADEDRTLLSGAMVGAYSQDQLGGLLVVETVSAEDGQRRIEAGDASGFLTIPDGFQDAFLNASPVTLTLKTNPSQTILPGIIEDVTEILLDVGFYAQQLLGPEIRQIVNADDETVPDDVFVAAIAVDIQDKIEAVAPKLFPPILDVTIVEPPPVEPQPDIGLLFLPGIVLMSVLFAANSLAADYWQEREQGTLRRLVSAPGALAGFVGGKAVAALLVVAGLAGITLTVGSIYHGVPWQRLVPSLAWVAIGGTGLFAWFAALQMLFSNKKAANLLTTILLFPLLMMGGSFFPLDTLPDWLAAIGRLSPNGFIVDKLTQELTAATAWTIDMNDWLLAAALTGLGLALCTWRLGAGFARR